MKYLLAVFLLISGCASFDAQSIPLEVTKAVVTVVPNIKFKSPKQRGKHSGMTWTVLGIARLC